jgi:flavin reductase (DIM6/NTAB) family NADH-FMN oxidoreductase RutF
MSVLRATMGFDSVQFREALGRFATGVCVITANPPGHAPFGLTVNSFASLSLTPPLVLWSLQKDSHDTEAFRVAHAATA